MTNKTKRIPAPVVQRLTKYLVLVQEQRKKGADWILSQEVAAALGLTSSTVRQDLSHLDFSGRSKCGYETRLLEQVLCRELGVDRTTKAVIVGVGNLGRALALHGEFEQWGVVVCGAFDSNKRLVGHKVGNLTVRDVSELPAVVRRHNAEIGMIAVPASAAQAVADDLASAGVRGILNLTPAHVNPAVDTQVVDVRITASLQELLYKMRTSSRSATGPDG